MSDDYEGSFDNRRAMITTLQFTAKIYLFGAVADNPDSNLLRELMLITLLIQIE